MPDALDILTRAKRLGLRLQVEGERIAISPARLCPPELLAEIRQHKPEIMPLLDAHGCRLPPDCRPWLHVARQVLEGEFDGCDSSTRESLNIGLRGIEHPACVRALAHLNPAPPQPRR